jgi:hypothetical protein
VNLRSRPFVIGTAIVAALLANYWVLEGALADRTNFDASWISDLSTRSEGSGTTFVELGLLAALALIVYGFELVAVLGGRGKLLRRGALAFLFAAFATLVAAAAPLSCAEGLEAACSLKEDPLDIVHSLATAGEIGGTILAFWLFGLGFRRAGRSDVAVITFAVGAVWLALTIVTGVSYLSHGVDEVKGAFQRLDQILFGVWLVVLACAATGTVQGVDPARR